MHLVLPLIHRDKMQVWYIATQLNLACRQSQPWERKIKSNCTQLTNLCFQSPAASHTEQCRPVLCPWQATYPFLRNIKVWPRRDQWSCHPFSSYQALGLTAACPGERDYGDIARDDPLNRCPRERSADHVRPGGPLLAHLPVCPRAFDIPQRVRIATVKSEATARK